ncbi:CBN-CLEC-212 protein [Caenorhabditis brenneri]|uniref:CBN-CLEC-212 protein n=1 Tax=Caenorhabditis brenneri TaxID=135651 RepID=G0MWT6_CAEBE|nr:CBN-CLEC-212 protein [Caenorhabditis brenneri]
MYLLLFSILPVFVLAVASLAPTPPQMIVLNGAVEANQEHCAHDEKIGNFTMCVVQCAKVDSCQFCFMDNGCWLCQEGVVSTDTEELRIGMKNVIKSNSRSCPSGSWHFNSNNNSLGSQTSPVSSDDTTTTKTVPTTTTTPKKYCPNQSSWTMFRNKWCIVTPFYNDSGFTHSVGLRECLRQPSSQRMYMSGLEYREMLIHLRVFARRQFKTFHNVSFAMWIDGYQSKPCTVNCFPGSFTFTDPHLQNYTSYEWYSKGNKVEFGGVGTCLQLMFPSNTSDARFGKVSYAECNVPQDKEFMRRAVVCGTLAV